MGIFETRPWTVTFIVMLVSLVFFFKIGTDHNESKQLERKISELEAAAENYEAFKELATGSKDFYTKTPVLFLDSGGEAKSIPIYSRNGSPAANPMGVFLVSGDKVKPIPVSSKPNAVGFAGQWSDYWKASWCDFIVTPPSSPGKYGLRFTNDNSETFHVLVIVK